MFAQCKLLSLICDSFIHDRLRLKEEIYSLSFKSINLSCHSNRHNVNVSQARQNWRRGGIKGSKGNANEPKHCSKCNDTHNKNISISNIYHRYWNIAHRCIAHNHI